MGHYDVEGVEFKNPVGPMTIPDKVSEPDWKSIAHLYAGFLTGVQMRLESFTYEGAELVAGEIAAFLEHSPVEHVAALYKPQD